jgi:hypothetical protein
MSILGAVVRTRPEHLDAVVPRVAALPGVDLALNPGDGRLVLVIEDAQVGDTVHGAAATLAAIATGPMHPLRRAKGRATTAPGAAASPRQPHRVNLVFLELIQRQGPAARAALKPNNLRRPGANTGPDGVDPNASQSS